MGPLTMKILAVVITLCLGGCVTSQTQPPGTPAWLADLLHGDEWPYTLTDMRVVKEMHWYWPNGAVYACRRVYEDGSESEVGYLVDGRKGFEMFSRRESPKGLVRQDGDPEASILVGLRVQYFPDCSGDNERPFRNCQPAMVIGVYSDGKRHQLEYSPEGAIRGDFWYGEKCSVITMTDRDYVLP